MSESEMAMIISSLNRWVTKKDISVNRSYGVGKIVQKIMSKARIISVSGTTISGNLSDYNNVFREVRKTMIQNFFSKEWVEHRKLVQAFEKVVGAFYIFFLL